MRSFWENHYISYFSVRLWIKTLFSTPDSGCRKSMHFIELLIFAIRLIYFHEVWFPRELRERRPGLHVKVPI